jgi:Zn-dependent M28 family amino/carboxypeptidase
MFEAITAPTRPNWMLRIAAGVLIVVLAAGLFSLLRMVRMPLKSYRGALPPLSGEQPELASRLREHVRYLSATIGERNIDHAGSLQAAGTYIRNQLSGSGYNVTEQAYTVEGHSVSNLEAQLPGSANGEGVLVVGAHYDSVTGTVGADDNASGVAATLELARSLKDANLRKAIRVVFFVNEEPPYFQTEQMGSFVYARQLRRDSVPVSAMISLEMLGYYSGQPGSQKYPAVLRWFYPNRGDFIGFVADSESRPLVRRAIRKFRESAKFPSEGVAAPANWPGIGWSDQWSFWQQSYPAIMITDTAVFRHPYYHTPQDTDEKIDFEKMARVVDGTRSVVAALADER